MTNKIEQIVESLKTLTLLEASELVKKIEEAFNVKVPTNIATATPQPLTNNDDEKKVEEKTNFNVILEEFPLDKKIAVLKVVRSLTGLGLKDAKELVESAPKQIQAELSKDLAEDAKKQIEAAGGKASLV